MHSLIRLSDKELVECVQQIQVEVKIFSDKAKCEPKRSYKKRFTQTKLIKAQQDSARVSLTGSH